MKKGIAHTDKILDWECELISLRDGYEEARDLYKKGTNTLYNLGLSETYRNSYKIVFERYGSDLKNLNPGKSIEDLTSFPKELNPSASLSLGLKIKINNQKQNLN